MLALERQEKLARLLQERGSIQVFRLAQILNVSEMTVRRDLDLLEKQGRLTRVHGGAMTSGQLQFGSRMLLNARSKNSLARKLQPSLPKVGCIYMDGSTTVFGLCDLMDGLIDVQVVTNNLQTFQRLCAVKGVKPFIIGGQLDSRTDNLVGTMARRALEPMHFDAAYFSCYGVMPEHGCMEATLEDAEVKEMVASRSTLSYIAVDESKLGRHATGIWRQSKERSILVTNMIPSMEKLKPYRETFLRIV